MSPSSASSALADGLVSCTGLIKLSESSFLMTYSPFGVTIVTLDSLLLVT